MLTRLLYRTLLKLSRKFDERPVNKAFILTEQIRFDQTDEYANDSQLEAMKYPEKALHQEIYNFCSPGVLYLPQKTIATSVRRAFRADDFYELDTAARIDLAFLAIRYLSHVQKVATDLTQSTAGTAAAVATIKDDRKIIPSVVHSPELQAGSLLISHPLWIPWPYNHSIILVWSYSDDHAIGLLVNKLYHVKFKEKLTKRERLRHSELKVFHDCPCFYGGNAENLTALNFSIIHRKHELADVSEKLELPLNMTAGAVLDLLNDGSADAVAAGAHAAQISDREDNVLYLTHDFEAVGTAISNGLISKHDIKIMHGCFNWTDSELQNYVNDHKLITIQSSHAVDIAMCNNYSQKSSNRTTRQVATMDMMSQWGHGYLSWAKTYNMMTGEFRAFSEVQQVNALEDSAYYYDELNTISSFGSCSNMEEDEDDDIDFTSDFITFDENLLEDDDYFHDDDD